MNNININNDDLINTSPIGIRNNINKKSKFKYYRTIDDKKDFHKIKYNLYGSLNLNCHWGQRKLFFSEFEFYSLLSKYYDLNKILIVYVGAAGGEHNNILFDFFPELKFLMYDPRPFNIDKKYVEQGRCILRTGKDGWFDDSRLSEIKTFNKENRHIAFICDMRVETDEKIIYEDMVSQARWTVLSNSIAYLLKTRIPYIESNINFDDFSIDIEKDIRIKDYKIVNKKTNEYDFLYLDGDIYLQIYAPKTSAETRCLYIKKNPNEPFQFKYYNAINYEEKNYFFNTFERRNTHYIGKSHLLKKFIFGFDDSYESATEYFINYCYLKFYKKINKPKIIDIIKLTWNIHNKFSKINNRELYDCNIKNIIILDNISDSTIQFFNNFSNKHNYKDIIYNFFKNYINNVIIYLKKQILWIKNNKFILDIMSQDILNFEIKKVNEYINKIDNIKNNKLNNMVSKLIKSLNNN